MSNMAGGSGSGVEASGLVNTLQGHVDDIRNLLQCGICIRPLYEPFTLACGHTFCYSCLSSWFSGGRSKRTCPDCRAPVETQPAPAYLVRAVVHMFTSRAELLDKEETTAEHQKNHQEESEKLDKDKANQNPHNGGLFRGLFRPRPPSLKPLVDVDDGVVRCPYCGWELENDQACGGCGYEYHPESSGTDYSDDFSETDDYDSMLDDEEAEEDDFGEMDDDASAWGPYDHFHSSIFGPLGALLDHPYHNHHHHHHHHPHPNPNPHRYPGPWAYTQAMTGSHPDEDDYNEEEEDEYEMDSFIDDEDHEHEHGQGNVSESDHSTVVGGARPNRMAPPRAGAGAPPFFYPPPPPYITESELEREAGLEAEESSEDSEDDNHLAAPSQPWEISSSSQGDHDVRSSPMCTDADEEDEDEDEDEDGPHTGHGRVYYQPSSISPPPNEESEPAESSSPPRPMRPSRNTGTSARHAITIDDSDDEQPVGPMRRARRQARFSPY